MKLRIAALAVAGLLALPALAGVSAGGPAPQFTLTARDGSSLSLAQLKGKVVLINFWATWCGPCRKEMPLLEAIYKKYSKLGFTLVGVNVEPDSKAAEGWLKQLSTPVSFPILFDTDSKVSQLYQVATMPSTVIIDRKGNVRLLHRGYKPGEENEYVDSVRNLIRE
jgi:peroxiredoxin